jgi:hypothetical protein
VPVVRYLDVHVSFSGRASREEPLAVRINIPKTGAMLRVVTANGDDYHDKLEGHVYLDRFPFAKPRLKSRELVP